MSDWLEDNLAEETERNDFAGPIMTPKVVSEWANQRLDKYLVNVMKGYSRNQIIRFIETDCVKHHSTDTFINEPDYRTKTDDVYVITLPQAQPAEPKAEKISLDILYEDNHIIVVLKPQMTACCPDESKDDNLFDQIKKYLKIFKFRLLIVVVASGFKKTAIKSYLLSIKIIE